MRTFSDIYYIPDDLDIRPAMERTTHLAIGAHHDDLEIMAYDGILKCFGNDQEWFFGVVVTDGASSPRAHLYNSCSDTEMKTIRHREQQKAAMVGEYAGVALLNYPSTKVKDANDSEVKASLKSLISATRPSVVYTHSPFDRHETHVAVMLRTVEALRELSDTFQPDKVYGCEVWGSLDWLPENDKIVFDVSGRENLENALLGVFDSQISGGKRYDRATAARRMANATYGESHQIDTQNAVILGLDLTQLVHDPKASILEYMSAILKRFEASHIKAIERMSE